MVEIVAPAVVVVPGMGTSVTAVIGIRFAVVVVAFALSVNTAGSTATPALIPAPTSAATTAAAAAAEVARGSEVVVPVAANAAEEVVIVAVAKLLVAEGCSGCPGCCCCCCCSSDVGEVAGNVDSDEVDDSLDIPGEATADEEDEVSAAESLMEKERGWAG